MPLIENRQSKWQQGLEALRDAFNSPPEVTPEEHLQLVREEQKSVADDEGDDDPRELDQLHEKYYEYAMAQSSSLHKWLRSKNSAMLLIRPCNAPGTDP